MDRRLTPRQLLIAVALFAVMVKLRWFAGIDQASSEWFALQRTPSLDAFAHALTFFGSSPWVLGVMGLMSGWWLSRGDRRTPAILWGAWGLGTLVQVLLRLTVAQWRPDAGLLPVPMDLWARFELAGFPSGHAFRSAFLYGWWARACRQRGVHWSVAAGCLALILGVGLTRVYLGRHWMSDVAGSWLLAAWALALARSWQGARAERRQA
jgi:membrane-associated phospholipid phosphatase